MIAKTWFLPALVLCGLCLTAGTAHAEGKPNIVVIFGDDIGQDNISAYHRGLLGNRTPNIDRIANEGAIFTDAYAQQSCTAGRAAFILGQLDCVATDTFDKTNEPRWGVVGKQKCKDAGPLTKKRMLTVEEEFRDRALDFMERAVAKNKASEEDQPFFMWLNSTRGHVWIHLSEKYSNKTGNGMFADAMAELDDVTGAVLDKLDELGVADNTIVIWTTDNGTEIMTGPDMSGMHPFKGEKGLTLEGGFRVPLLVRWPGKVKQGIVINDMMSHIDWSRPCWPRPTAARIRGSRRS